MKTVVHVITGYTYTSDSYSIDEIRAQFQKERPGATEVEFEQEIYRLVEFYKSVNKIGHLTIQVKGNERSFNGDHIVWIETDMEGESLPTAATEAEREAQRAERDRIRNEQLAKFDGRAATRRRI